MMEMQMGIPVPQDTGGIDRHVCISLCSNGVIVKLKKPIPVSRALAIPGAMIAGLPSVMKGMHDATSPEGESEFAESLRSDDAPEVESVDPAEAMKRLQDQMTEAEKNIPKPVRILVFTDIPLAMKCVQNFLEEK